MRQTIPFFMSMILLVAPSCSLFKTQTDNLDPVTDAGSPVVLSDMAKSTKNDVRWLRARAFESRLGQALLLNAGELCKEMGMYSCVDEVHLVALGGNDPYEKGLYEPLASPAVTTPVAVERMVISACSAAVEKERSAAQQFVFLDLDLEASQLDTTDAQTDLAVADTIVSLYRRLHVRNPLPSEAELVRQLLVDDDGNNVSAIDFAKLACIAIASTSESVFY
jgi:hypothetical protein